MEREKPIWIDTQRIKRDTIGMSGAEIGAYILLIIHLYEGYKITDDDKETARLLRTTKPQWLKIKPKICHLFTKAWTSPMVDKMLAYGKQLSSKRSAAAYAMHAKRRDRKPVDEPIDEEKAVLLLREQIVSRFVRRGLTPPDHLAQLGIWIGMGYSPTMILAAVDSGLEQRGHKFTTMNYINTILENQRRKPEVVQEPKEPPPNKMGSPAHLNNVLSLFKEKGYWEINQFTGMRPGTCGCLIPKELLEKYGLPPTPPYPYELKRKKQIDA